MPHLESRRLHRFLFVCCLAIRQDIVAIECVSFSILCISCMYCLSCVIVYIVVIFNACPVSERQYALRPWNFRPGMSQRGKANWRIVTRVVCHFFQTFIMAFLSALIGRVERLSLNILWLQFNQSVSISSWPRFRRFSSLWTKLCPSVELSTWICISFA